MCAQHIAWPAIIHFSGDSELIFIASQTEWESDEDLYAGHYEEMYDRLIDSQGTIYSLKQNHNNVNSVQPTGRAASLEDVIALVKAHLSDQGSCCVSKLFAPSIAAAIAIAFPDSA